MQLHDMYQNNIFLDAIHHEAVKVMLTPIIRTAFLVTASHQKYLDLPLKVMIIYHFVKPVSWTEIFIDQKFPSF